METKTASARRTSEYTQVKKCDGCSRALWAKKSWDRVNVKCPHCKHIH